MTDRNPTKKAPATPVTVENNENVAVLKFDDGKANVLGFESINLLHTVLDDLSDNADAIVLVGRPGRFSAGFDLEVIKSGADAAARMFERGVDLFLRLYQYPRPVVAACTGHAIAAGAIVLMSCDLRIGLGGEFKIGLPEVTIGMPLPFFATELARDRLSKRHYTQATALGRMYNPEEAVDVGFLDELSDNDVIGSAIDRAQLLTGISRSGFLRTRANSRDTTSKAIRAHLAEDLSHFSVESN